MNHYVLSRLVLWFLVVFFVASGRVSKGYDVVTHRAIAERAVDTSLLDGYLRTELGFQSGTGQIIFGESVRDRIGLGARFEDEPFRRVLNHFHNPLQPWNQAGLRVGFQLGQSSVLWQQNTNQDSSSVFVPFPLKTGGGNWSWQDARRHYLNALTLHKKADSDPKKEDRDKAFANTFEVLGGLTHLLQDASVPAHVRNDPHPRPLRNPDWYEDWIKETKGTDESVNNNRA